MEQVFRELTIRLLNNLLRWDGSTVQRVYGRNLTKTKQLHVTTEKRTKRMKNKEMVEHPDHYGGKDNPYEVVKVAEAWGLDKDAYLFNVIKYIGRSGKKDDNPTIQDLEKAVWYLNRRIKNLKD
jgi:hypothetical protein